MSDVAPWKDPNHPSYTGPKTTHCIGCGDPCTKSSWGRWCFPCNFARMSRIDKDMKRLEQLLGLNEGD